MDLLDSERRVVDAAVALAGRLGADPNHTVAAAVMDTRGRIHTGVNVYHFTGGPCAELVALGVAAAADAGPLLTIAAAGDGGRGVIEPCGRCRQVLVELHPDILVAVPGANGPQLRTLNTLLPETYNHRDARPARLVRFNKRYYDDVVTGRKTVTVRHDDPIAVGPALLVFEDDPPRTLPGEVHSVASYRLDLLRPEQAGVDSPEALVRLRDGLRGHYPDLTPTATVEVVRFGVRAGGAVG
ncbi:hypothetical protein [Occultella gossypii]|uniref:hypothetical protein n=1 Tax=Occultella gossypii TaxID=2800820 RepID=UPI001CBDC24E|nr:hypothetical protein [Occultella gossypii]